MQQAPGDCEEMFRKRRQWYACKKSPAMVGGPGVTARHIHLHHALVDACPNLYRLHTVPFQHSWVLSTEWMVTEGLAHGKT